MKNLMTILGVSLVIAVVFSSCGGSEDAKENGDKAGKCDCKMYELVIEEYKLKEEQLETYDEDDGEIDDREKYAELELDIFDIEIKQYDLQKEIQTYRMQVYAGENFHDEDDEEEWEEDFEDAREDYVDDNCEDEKEDAEEASEDYYDERRKLYEKEESKYYDRAEPKRAETSEGEGRAE